MIQEAGPGQAGMLDTGRRPDKDRATLAPTLTAVLLGLAIPLLAALARLVPPSHLHDLVYALLAVPLALAATSFGAVGAAAAGLAALASAWATAPVQPLLVQVYLGSLAAALVGATYTLHRRHLALVATNRRLAQMATRDALTGLLNSRAFWTGLREVLNTHRRTGQPLSLLLLDLDNFKEFNDRYGHLAGDAMLAAVGKALLRCVRASDLACRYGGDELAVIAPNTDEAEAGQMAERIQACLSTVTIPGAPVTKQGAPPAITASIGIASVPPSGSTADELVAAADRALYAAKARGRNSVALASGRSPFGG